VSDQAPDPVLRAIGGCALVLVGLAAIVVVVGLVVGLKLTRDETPGRPEEAFLLGDESRYWCFDLKPDDPGLVAVNDKLGESAEAARDQALANSPLRFLPLGHRRNQLGDSLPLKVELAVAQDGWSGRATFAKGVMRMRAVVKILRWFIGRASKEADVADVDGVEITTIRAEHGGVASMTMVGNRLLLSGTPQRLARALAIDRAAGATRDPSIDGMHAAVRLAGEDGWAFAAGPAVASFDVDAGDALVFRIAAGPGVAAGEAMSSEAAMALARAFLPYVAEDAIRLDEGFPKRGDDGLWLVAGRIPELSRRVGAAILRFSASRAEGAPSPRSPSAIPLPPSPPPSSDPRNGTPAGPTHGGIPNPVR
jgi:hypothetical protein